MSLDNIIYVFNQAEPSNPCQRLVLLVLADMANHDNEAWRGIALLTRKSSLSERSVHYAIKGLQKGGFIEVKVGGNYRGDSNTYVICRKSTGANLAPVGVQTVQSTGANGAVTGANGAPVGVQTVQSTGANLAPHPSGNPNLLTLSEPTGRPDGQRPSDLSIAQLFFVSHHSTEAHAEEFYDHYERCGWKLNTGRALVSWHAAARSWIREAVRRAALPGQSGPKNFGGSGAGAASTYTLGVTPASPELNKLLNDPNWTGGIVPDPDRSASDETAA
jgi:hypothetical protein